MTFLTLVFLLAQSDEYHGLVNQDGRSCCGVNDCAAYSQDEVRYENGALEILYQGQWLQVPEGAILSQASWDGMLHACVAPGYGWRGAGPVPQNHVLCVILPGVA